jgi:tRNA nucleotidyltransferase (CCA-adding enzyme)
MHDRLFIKIQEFTILIENNLKLSNNIYECTIERALDLIENHIENRDRSLNIIELTQIEIEKSINALTATEMDHQTIDIIKSWAKETQDWINNTISIDQSILVNLESEKDQTTQEIIQVFKSKQAFKGYDLSDVSK